MALLFNSRLLRVVAVGTARFQRADFCILRKSRKPIKRPDTWHSTLPPGCPSYKRIGECKHP